MFWILVTVLKFHFSSLIMLIGSALFHLVIRAVFLSYLAFQGTKSYSLIINSIFHFFLLHSFLFIFLLFFSNSVLWFDLFLPFLCYTVKAFISGGCLGNRNKHFSIRGNVDAVTCLPKYGTVAHFSSFAIEAEFSCQSQSLVVDPSLTFTCVGLLSKITLKI